MKARFPENVERGRILEGSHGTKLGDRFGAFHIRCPKTNHVLQVVASSAEDTALEHPDMDPWDHVSVSLRNRPPNWDEMCFIKDLFFDDDECVFQFHPPRSEYVNLHPNVLHLWKPAKHTIPMPPVKCV